MQQNRTSTNILQAQLAELGILFSWIYNCDTKHWDVTAPIASLTGNSLLQPDDFHHYFFNYIELIPIDNRERIKNILQGNFPDEEGSLNYSITMENQVHYHKCKYNRLSENNQTKIIGTICRNTDNINKQIIETIPDFIFIFDRNFKLLDIMKSNKINLHHTREELIDKDGRTLYSAEASELYIKAIHQCLDEQRLIEIEYPLDVPQGRFYYQARMVPFEENKVLTLIHDITEKVVQKNQLVEAKQRAEEADSMKSTFLANMSHEIRTPLNAIAGFSELLTNTDDPTEKKEYNAIIQTNSELLLQLINDILDLSRIESGKIEIIHQLTDISGILENIKNIYEIKMNPGVELRLSMPEEKIEAETDLQRVTQVLFNFMSNAVKNTPKGTITLGLTTSDKEIRLFVKDTGYGIPPDKLQIIFERFIKINDFVQGTGLGLAICRTIADKLQGRIDVESEYGKGSTFSLYIPRL